jgi:recombination protein RecT
MPRTHQLLHAQREPVTATGQPLEAGSPRAGLLAGKETHFMAHEPPFGELALVCPDGQVLHPLDWRCDQPVPLLRNLMRLTAPNPGVMTGPGTNSYLVGDPLSGYVAIDPGPDEPEHIERLWRAAGGDIRMIVCTHSHPDHSPGARPLQALCQQRRDCRPHPNPLPGGEGAKPAAGSLPPLPLGEGGGEGAPPILGLPSAPTARPNSHFTPDEALADGALLTLAGQNGEPRNTHTLKVIHTPGHAANHLCLVLVEDGLLFSGDHILNGSTTVVNPPDGNMTAYLDSLDALSAACGEHGIHFILPAHGHVLGQAQDAIARLKTHRLQREAKVLRVMQAHPGGTLDDWVAHAYDDVHPRIWPLAKRSLLAHVERLQSLAPDNTP